MLAALPIAGDVGDDPDRRGSERVRFVGDERLPITVSGGTVRHTAIYCSLLCSGHALASAPKGSKVSGNPPLFPGDRCSGTLVSCHHGPATLVRIRRRRLADASKIVYSGQRQVLIASRSRRAPAAGLALRRLLDPGFGPVPRPRGIDRPSGSSGPSRGWVTRPHRHHMAAPKDLYDVTGSRFK